MKKPAVTDTQETDADDLLSALEKLYWMSVEKEAQNMIEFYAELCSSSDLVLQPQIDLESCCKSFKRIFEVWGADVVSSDT